MKALFWRLLGSGLALGAIGAMVLISTSDDANAAVFAHQYDGYITRTYTDARGASMTYYLYVPHGYNPRQSYPLVLLLHGGGERGDAASTLAQNRSLLLNDAYANVWSSPTVQSRWPSFIVVPQVMGTNQIASTSLGFRWAAMAPGMRLNAGPRISRRQRPSRALVTRPRPVSLQRRARKPCAFRQG